MARLLLRVEALEDRCVPAVITVTTTLDTIAIDGLATLREAITSINNQADVNADVTANRVGGYASTSGGTPDVINFNIPGAGVQKITVTAAEPPIVKPLIVNGYSQTGASANTMANSDNAVILIQLDGTSAGTNVNGLTLGASSVGSTIKGLDITNFQADVNFNGGVGILIQSNGNTVVGNFVGVNPAGTTQMPNGSDGIRIVSASNNMIGTTNVADRNIVSGNTLDGIHIEGTLTTPATGNIIQGNFVGVAADGKSGVGMRTTAIPNAAAMGTASGNFLSGIEISGGNSNTVGGTAAGGRNVIGFNANGIEIDNGGQNNIIQGNFSGVGADGVTSAGNLQHGIVLRSSNGLTAPLGSAQPNEPGVSSNTIGGTASGAGNLVEFNGTGGIAVFGNPVSASGQPNVGNAIEGNSIFQNGRTSGATPLLGIDLTNGFVFPKDDGATANDSKGHGAAGDPNNFQNFPVLTSATTSGGMTTVTGTLTQSVSPNTTFRIEFFANNVDSLGLPAEGQQFLGFVNVTTDGTGKATFSTSFNVAVANGRIVTATATDPTGNTSEFSAGLTVPTSLPPVMPPTPTPLFAVGTGGGVLATVIVYNADGTTRFSLTPYAGFEGPVTVAVGNVSGDGIDDIITGATTGHVEVFDGADGTLLQSFYAFPGYLGNIVLAAGDVNSDGHADIIVGAAVGSAGGHIKVFDGADGSVLQSFYAFPGYNGPIVVAAGDVNGDGKADIIVGASGTLGEHVKAFSGVDGSQLLSFYSLPGFSGPISLAAGSLTGGASADIIVGAGAGGTAASVNVFSGADGTPVEKFFPFPGFIGAVRVAARDLNGDGKADIIVGVGPGAPNGHVKAFDGSSLVLFESFVAFPNYSGGVFVG